MNFHAVRYVTNCGVERSGVVRMPELTAYGYDGGHGFSRANREYERELGRRAQAWAGLADANGRFIRSGGCLEYVDAAGTVLTVQL